MNTGDDTELERVLRRLPLRPPSAALDDRIAAGVRRRYHPIRWAAAAAVLLTAGAMWQMNRPRPASPVAQIGPPLAEAVSVERITSRTMDDGVVAVADHVPYRQVRQQTVREIWWADPATGARLWAQLPTEQVTVEPAETF